MKITNKNKTLKKCQNISFCKKEKEKKKTKMFVGTISLEAHLCVLKNL